MGAPQYIKRKQRGAKQGLSSASLAAPWQSLTNRGNVSIVMNKVILDRYSEVKDCQYVSYPQNLSLLGPGNNLSNEQDQDQEERMGIHFAAPAASLIRNVSRIELRLPIYLLLISWFLRIQVQEQAWQSRNAEIRQQHCRNFVDWQY